MDDERTNTQQQASQDLSQWPSQQHPAATPYFKWKVFVKAEPPPQENHEEGAGNGRDRPQASTQLDGEDVMRLYKSITTGMTDRQTDGDICMDTDEDRQTDRDGYIVANDNLQTDIDRNGCPNYRDKQANSHKRMDKDRKRHTDRNRQPIKETDTHCLAKTNKLVDENEISTNNRNTHTDRHRHPNADIHSNQADPDRQTQQQRILAADNFPTITTAPSLHTIHRAMRFAQEDNAAALINELDQGLSVNTKDEHGWSLLMTAACGGASSVVRMLLDRKARTGYRDGRGRTAIYLATMKGHRNVTEMLIKANKHRNRTEANKHQNRVEETQDRAGNPINTEENDREFFCEICETTVEETSRAKHRTSIVHQFKTGGGAAGTIYGIPPTNRGYRLLVQQGWDRDKGLGIEGHGRKYPVKTVLKRDRLGIGGGGKTGARVTHFAAGDTEAVRRADRVERKATIGKREAQKKKAAEQMEEKRIRQMLNEPDY